MPIRPDLRKRFYGAHWRNVVRPRILARAGGKFDASGKYLGGAKCEQCGKPDREYVYVYASEACGQYWTKALRPVELQRWTYCLLGVSGNFMLRNFRLARRIVVILTTAHLNHTPGDDRDENLKCLCSWCHLHYDAQIHLRNAHITRATRKDRKRPLLEAASA